MNWDDIHEFNFTYAIDGGAWLKDGRNNVNWFTFAEILRHKTKEWLKACHAKQGWLTGCWITVTDIQ